MENRLRRRDILADEEELFLFYRNRLDNVYSLAGLKKRIGEKGGDRFLRMTEEDLLRYHPDREELSNYPDRITMGGMDFDCEYYYEPGNQKDGVSVRVSSGLAATVPSQSLDWLVPGLLREKIIALIKGLPKKYRKQLVPVPDVADEIVKQMPRNDKPLISTLSHSIKKMYGIDIPAREWEEESLPDYLKMRLVITDSEGREICSGRDRSLLQKKVTKGANTEDLEEIRKKEEGRKWEIQGVDSWNFGDLPPVVTISGNDGKSWQLYPGLEIADKTVNLRLFLHREQALKSHKEGVKRLFELYFSKDLKFLKKMFKLSGDKTRAADYFGGVKAFENKVFESVKTDLFFKDIRKQNDFYEKAKQLSPVLDEYGKDKFEKCSQVLKAYSEARTAIYDLETANRKSPVFVSFLADLKKELVRLVPENYMDLYEPDRLPEIVRYIEAISIRAEKGILNYDKDVSRAKELDVQRKRLESILEDLTPETTEEKKTAVEDYFWLIEEYKVSLFAQELKTSVPVSRKRLDEKYGQIEKMV
jgi:ATP-dependent helicase HrpA